MKFLKALTAILLICILIFKLPQAHYDYIRNSVGSKVVKITNSAGTSGGTGFHIKAPSGKTYILTNSHICEHISENGSVQIHDTRGYIMPRRVLYDSEFTDLCVVEGMPGISGLSLGSAPEAGNVVAVVGHPHLMANTMSRGEIISEEMVETLDHVMTSDPTDLCNKPKNKIEEINLGFFSLQACIVKIKAYQSNVTILPGNSGSPIVNFFGNVVAVAFAGDSTSNWGDFVTFSDISKTLAPF